MKPSRKPTPKPAADKPAVSATAQYLSALADYNRRAAEALAAIRTKLNDPTWLPRHHKSLGIGNPPRHPLT